MRSLWLLLFFSTAALADDRVGFVQEYLRELHELNAVRLHAGTDLGSDPHQKIASCIRNMTAINLEIGTYPSRLRAFHIEGQFKQFPEIVAGVYEMQGTLYKQMSGLCEQLIAPKDGVDYGPIAAQAPKINAELDFNEKSLFQVSPAVALMLVDQTKTNKAGNYDHLSLTKAARKEMLAGIARDFPTVEAKDANYLVSAASIVKKMLRNPIYRSADEP